MSDADREAQIVLIRKSFQTNTMKKKTKPIVPRIATTKAPVSVLRVVQDLASGIYEGAFVSKDGALGWLAFEPAFNLDEWHLQPIGETLYSGRLGIALFFAALAKISKEKKWRIAALQCLIPLRAALAEPPNTIGPIVHSMGGMAGIGSLLYGLLCISRLIEMPSLALEGISLIDQFDEATFELDTEGDLIYGSAGLLLALSTYSVLVEAPQALRLAAQCVRYLISKAESYHTPEPSNVHLGLSHGASGIALALLRATKILPDQASMLTEAAAKALAYERRFFSEKERNWPRLNSQESIMQYQSSWCHGATGIGLMRLSVLSLLPQDLYIRNEIDTALQTTIAYLNQGSLTLCCGLAGRLEFLHAARHVLKTDDLSATIADAIATLAHNIQLPHVVDAQHNPGLMQGAAGLGFSLLRAIDHHKMLPNILTLS
jgi:type 2 lantibiotic biosynthesis protein LanM